MKTALITLSDEGARVVAKLRSALPEADCYQHDIVSPPGFESFRFTGIIDLTADIFANYDALVFIMPCGVAVRAIAPNLTSKLKDPAVVLVDVGGRWAVSLLSGHEGGANDLALRISNIIGAEPIITTTTEAVKNHIVGVGCRSGISAQEVKSAILAALDLVRVSVEQIRFIASADIKNEEKGLIDAAEELDIPLRFIGSEEIRNCAFDFERSEFVRQKVDLPAVAEPAALLAGRKTKLVLQKTKFNGITIAIARENCS
jgi:cobalt-precorrin 5A hydrolase